MKFSTKVRGPKSKKAFVGGQNPMIPSPILPQFLPRNAFSMGRSKFRSNEARGPIVGVESSKDVPRERLQVQSCKVHFQLEYAWLSV